MAELAEASSSAEKIELTNNLDVYPNPTSGRLFIEYSGLPTGALKVDIVDIQGKLVFELPVQERSGQGKIQIEPEVGPGVYFLRLHAGDKMRTSRFVVQ